MFGDVETNEGKQNYYSNKYPWANIFPAKFNYFSVVLGNNNDL